MKLAITPWMLAVARPAHPARPVVTPTRLPGLAAALRRLATRCHDALRAEPLPYPDGADPHAARRMAAAD